MPVSSKKRTGPAAVATGFFFFIRWTELGLITTVDRRKSALHSPSGNVLVTKIR